MVRKITLYSRGKCGIWREAAITPGLEANFGLGNTSTFYGRVSAVGAYMWGVDKESLHTKIMVIRKMQ